jgi:hypothetical protein
MFATMLPPFSDARDSTGLLVWAVSPVHYDLGFRTMPVHNLGNYV